MTPPVPAERLAPADVPAAVDALAAAFADYAMLRAVVPAGVGRAACRSFCRVLLRYSVQLGHAYATPGGSAVACWLPPDRPWLSVPGLVHAGVLAWLWRFGPLGTLRLERLGRAFDAARAAHVPGPHWYLNLLGVRPDCQGKGLSRAVLRPVFAEADRAGRPCYLETQDEANVGIYRRLGFDLVGERPLFGGLRNWEMVRRGGS